MALAGSAKAKVITAMYLLDTNVISELRRQRPNRGLIAWLSNVASDEIFLSAVTIGELQAGVENMRPQDQTRAEAIESWVSSVAENYNVLDMNIPTFRQWARLMRGQPLELVADAMIAATAIVHNLTVVTRNQRDFERLGLIPISPFGNA